MTGLQAVPLDSYETPLSLIAKHHSLNGRGPIYVFYDEELDAETAFVSSRPISKQQVLQFLEKGE